MTGITFVALLIGALLAQLSFPAAKKAEPAKPEPDARDRALEALFKAYLSAESDAQENGAQDGKKQKK